MCMVNKDNFTVPVSEGGGVCRVATAFKMTERVEQQIWIQFCVKLEHTSTETIGMSQKAPGDDVMSAAQIKMWHKCFKDGRESVGWSMFWKACNKQNTRECRTCTGCNQQRSTTDSVRTRSWSGDSKNYCVRDFDTGSWHETCCGKICTRAEGTLCCSCWWLNSKHHQWTRFPQEGHNFEGGWDVIVLCTMFLVSSSIHAFSVRGWIFSGQTQH